MAATGLRSLLPVVCLAYRCTMLLWSLHRRHCDHGESTVSPVYVPLRILQYGSDYCSDAPCQWLPGISDSICVRHWIVQNHNMQSPTTEHSAIFAIQILRCQMCISSAMLRYFSEFHVTFVTMSGDVSQNSLVGDASQKSASPAQRITISLSALRYLHPTSV